MSGAASAVHSSSNMFSPTKSASKGVSASGIFSPKRSFRYTFVNVSSSSPSSSTNALFGPTPDATGPSSGSEIGDENASAGVLNMMSPASAAPTTTPAKPTSAVANGGSSENAEDALLAEELSRYPGKDDDVSIAKACASFNASISHADATVDADAVDSFGFNLCTGRENISFERFAKRRDNGMLCRIAQLASAQRRWDAFYVSHGLSTPVPIAQTAHVTASSASSSSSSSSSSSASSVAPTSLFGDDASSLRDDSVDSSSALSLEVASSPTMLSALPAPTTATRASTLSSSSDAVEDLLTLNSSILDEVERPLEEVESAPPTPERQSAAQHQDDAADNNEADIEKDSGGESLFSSICNLRLGHLDDPDASSSSSPSFSLNPLSNTSSTSSSLFSPVESASSSSSSTAPEPPSLFARRPSYTSTKPSSTPCSSSSSTPRAPLPATPALPAGPAGGAVTVPTPTFAQLAAASAHLSPEFVRLVEMVGFDPRLRADAWFEWSGAAALKKRAEDRFAADMAALANEVSASPNRAATYSRDAAADEALAERMWATKAGLNTPRHLLTYAQLRRHPLYSRAFNCLLDEHDRPIKDPNPPLPPTLSSASSSVPSPSSSSSSSDALNSSSEASVDGSSTTSGSTRGRSASMIQCANVPAVASRFFPEGSGAHFTAMRSTLEQIDRDVTRTTCQHPYFTTPASHQALTRLLSAYAYRNPGLGYLQSMNFLCAKLLVVFGPMREEDVFWTLAALVEDLLPDHYTPRLRGLRVLMTVFTDLVASEMPWVATQLEKASADVSFRSVSWFLCLFFTYLPPEAVVLCWDTFFVHCAEARANQEGGFDGLAKPAPSRLASPRGPALTSATSAAGKAGKAGRGKEVRELRSFGTYVDQRTVIDVEVKTSAQEKQQPPCGEEEEELSEDVSPVYARACAVLCCFGMGLLQEVFLRLEKASVSSLGASEVLQTAGSYVVDAHRLASFAFTSHSVIHIADCVRTRRAAHVAEEKRARQELEARRRQRIAARLQQQQQQSSSSSPVRKTPVHARKASRTKGLFGSNSNKSQQAASSPSPFVDGVVFSPFGQGSALDPSVGATEAQGGGALPKTPSATSAKKKTSALNSLLSPFSSIIRSLKSTPKQPKYEDHDGDVVSSSSSSAAASSSSSSTRRRLEVTLEDANDDDGDAAVLEEINGRDRAASNASKTPAGKNTQRGGSASSKKPAKPVMEMGVVCVRSKNPALTPSSPYHAGSAAVGSAGTPLQSGGKVGPTHARRHSRSNSRVLTPSAIAKLCPQSPSSSSSFSSSSSSSSTMFASPGHRRQPSSSSSSSSSLFSSSFCGGLGASPASGLTPGRATPGHARKLSLRRPPAAAFSPRSARVVFFAQSGSGSSCNDPSALSASTATSSSSLPAVDEASSFSTDTSTATVSPTTDASMHGDAQGTKSVKTTGLVIRMDVTSDGKANDNSNNDSSFAGGLCDIDEEGIGFVTSMPSLLSGAASASPSNTAGTSSAATANADDEIQVTCNLASLSPPPRRLPSHPLSPMSGKGVRPRIMFDTTPLPASSISHSSQSPRPSGPSVLTPSAPSSARKLGVSPHVQRTPIRSMYARGGGALPSPLPARSSRAVNSTPPHSSGMAAPTTAPASARSSPSAAGISTPVRGLSASVLSPPKSGARMGTTPTTITTPKSNITGAVHTRNRSITMFSSSFASASPPSHSVAVAGGSSSTGRTPRPSPSSMKITISNLDIVDE